MAIRKFRRVVRVLIQRGGLIYVPVALFGFFAPAIANATSDSLPFTPANNGCGPYQALTVTGTTGGPIWGSNPYTDDSKFSAAAVHAGLIAVGETAIIEPYMVDNYPSYQGSTANGISTYDWGGSWCGYYIRILGTGGDTTTTTTTTTTTLPPYLNQVTNLIAVAKPDGSVDLGWDAPTPSNVDIYAYSVSFYDLDEIGGTASGGWGVWTNQGTTYSLAEYMFSGSNPVTTGFGPVRFGIKAGNQSCFSSEGVGACVYGPETTVDVTVLDPTPPTTTTTEPPTTEAPIESTVPETSEPVESTIPETSDPVEQIIPETSEPEITPDTEVETIPATDPPTTEPEIVELPTTDPVEEEAPETTLPVEEGEPETTVEEPTEESPTVVDDIIDGDLTAAELTEAVEDALANAGSEEELVSIATDLLTSDLDSEQFAAAADAIFGQELSDEAFAEVLDAVFEEPLSDEEFDSVISAILDEPISDEAFDELIDVLGGDSVSDEQVVAAVDAIIENGLSEEQSLSIATSGEVLSSITQDQASEIFATVPVSELTEESAGAIVEAVQGAPEEVKEAFEEEINVFAGVFDNYVPIGSIIDVGQRRLIIAATAVVFAMPAPIISSRRIL